MGTVVSNNNARAATATGIAVGDLVFAQNQSASHVETPERIVIRRASDNSETTLTSRADDDAASPDVSPDGSKIAYTNYLLNADHSNGGRGIWVMNSDGSGQTQLTAPNVVSSLGNPSWFYDFSPRWSPDGTKMVFTRETYDLGSARYLWHIYTMNADGSGATDLTPNDTVGNDHPVLSPDGTQIAYEHNTGTFPQVWVMNRDGSNPHVVDPSTSYMSFSPDWAPDGSRLYFWRNMSGDVKLAYLTSRDGFATAANSTEHVVRDLQNRAVGQLRVSGDGSTVYFDGNGIDLYQITVSDGTETQITNGEYDQSPAPVKAVLLPSAPVVSVAIPLPTDPPNIRTLTLSLQLSDARFQPNLLGYDLGLTLDPLATSPNWYVGPEAGDTPLYIDVSMYASPTVDVYAMATATFSGHSPNYTTPWSQPILIWGPDFQGGPPPPPPPLAVNNATITAAVSDKLLNRTILFSTVDPAEKVARYEYGWGSKPTATVPARTQRCATTLAKCLLNFGPASPDTDWNLFVRAIGTNGKPGPWHQQIVRTPRTPVLILGGDSNPAGHHRDSEGVPTVCHDAAYSFGQTIWNQLQGDLTPQWREPNGYLNFAQSGFSTTNMLTTGVDPCNVLHTEMVFSATAILEAHAGSWNTVVWDGGIDDTNWVDVVKSIVEASVKRKANTAAKCDSLMSAWNLPTDTGIQQKLSSNIQSIVTQIAAADPLAKRYWTSYYNIAGTGTLALNVPAVCKASIDVALQKIGDIQETALVGSGFSWLDVNPVLGGKDRLLQDIYLSDTVFGAAGWPHPNKKGAASIGAVVINFRY